jgi:hypothetical protein
MISISIKFTEVKNRGHMKVMKGDYHAYNGLGFKSCCCIVRTFNSINHIIIVNKKLTWNYYMCCNPANGRETVRLDPTS